MDEQIRFEHKLRSEAYIKGVQKLYGFAALAIPVCVFLVLFFSDINHPALIMAFGLATLVICILGWLMFDEFYGWLSKEDCGELLSLCQTHSDLNDYRLKVIASGREFTAGEYYAMRDWPKIKKALEASLNEKRANLDKCKTLYQFDESGVENV